METRAQRKKRENSIVLKKPSIRVTLNRLTNEELLAYGVVLSKNNQENNRKRKRNAVRNDEKNIANDDRNGYAEEPENNRKRKRNAIRNDEKHIKNDDSKEHNGLKNFKKAKMLLQERIMNDTPDKEFLVNEIVLVTIPGLCNLYFNFCIFYIFMFSLLFLRFLSLA